ncbi:cupin domain-containing protein [Roseomonas eburnea]|uniref:Cupin domain-containing protein n=1 Tax=Neoroseomonas eburnea TaxID=1346889 RepID=A0A9X9XHD3_9PROT|nr:cupin domain-containing protein [Neoroseomonas eburnea]MBR0683119.1 cupin domain-containing protein [Neoroseomonas eburnea]
MTALTAGITPAGEGIGGVVWNILGQTYKPVASGDSCFAFDALFPPETFVPPHIHTTQDEFIRVLEGRFDLVLDGQPMQATAGDLIRMPMGIMHGIFNKSGAPVRALFWVSPARSLETLFQRIHNVADPAEVVRIASEHEVTFLPPAG